METQLADLLDTIREEGLEKTKQEADALLRTAKDTARTIIEEAEETAAKMGKKSQREYTKLMEDGKASLQHALRDSVLMLEKEVMCVFDNLLSQQMQDALSAESIAGSIQQIITQVGKQMEQIHLHLPEQAVTVVQSVLQKKLGQRLQKKLHIVVDAQLNAGFQISQKDAGIHLDFSQKAITDFLVQRLHPRLQEIMRKS